MDDKTLEIIKRREKKRQIIIADLITGGIALAVGALIFLLYFFLNVEGRTLKTACNGCALAAGVLICAGFLVWLNRLGAFDTFAYGFIQLGTMMFGKNPIKRDSLSDYKENRREKRKDKSKYYFVIMIAGGLFLIALAVLEILFNITYAR